jgi:hypothetical protein
MKSNYMLLLIIASFYIVGCKSGSNDTGDGEIDSTSMESVDATTVNMNDETSVVDTVIEEVVYKDPEVQEAHVEIVKKYGVQWDFCTCVQKSDSVNTALMEAADEDFDVVMVRSEYIDSKCKGLLIQPNGTPEDRYKHEKKVKKCLSNK